VGDHRDVVGRDFDGGGAHASGELALGLGRDGLIAVGDHEPGRVTSRPGRRLMVAPPGAKVMLDGF
jgi:hypothetical protein